MDSREVSPHECGDWEAHQGGTLGGRGRHVGGAGPEHAGRGIAGAATAGGQALVQAGLRGGCEGGVESRLVWIHVATAANLQEERGGLFRHAEDGVERYE